MKFLQSILSVLLTFISITAFGQKGKIYQLISPDGKNIVKIEAGDKLLWSVTNNSTEVIVPSEISMLLKGTGVLGTDVKITSAKTEKVNTIIHAINYKKDIIPDVYNQLTLNCKGDYGVIFRAYNDGVAYRFFTKKKGDINIINEEANFNFDKDYKCYMPFVRDFRGTEQYIQSFRSIVYGEEIFLNFLKTRLLFYQY